MRVPMSSSAASLGDDCEGDVKSRASFIQTALLLGSGIGMSVEPKSLQFLPMPMSDVRPRDHKVLLAVLAHTTEAVGIAKDLVGIDVVKGSLAAVQSLLAVVKVRSHAPYRFRTMFLMGRSLNQEIIMNRREIAEVSIQCAQVFLIVKRGTLGKSEADINPSILAAASDLTRYVVSRDCWYLR
jgi:hypothetical protein